MNAVEEHREKMRGLQSSAVELSRHSALSPCGLYRLELIEQRHDEKGHCHYYWGIVSREDTQQLIVDFFTDTDDDFPGWIRSQGRDYLLFAEFEGGQTVIDLQDGILSSFHDPGDEFIWTDFHLSPSGLRLAVGGCFWACPSDVRVYDFSRPVGGMLPVLGHFDGADSNLKFEEWLDECHFIASDGRGGHTFELAPAG